MAASLFGLLIVRDELFPRHPNPARQYPAPKLPSPSSPTSGHCFRSSAMPLEQAQPMRFASSVG
jgi:hypothetical protein